MFENARAALLDNEIEASPILSERLQIALTSDGLGRTLLAHAVPEGNETSVEALMDLADWAWRDEDNDNETLSMRLAWYPASICAGRVFSRSATSGPSVGSPTPRASGPKPAARL